MNKEDIIRMARETQQESFAGGTGHWFKMEVKDLERFASLVAAAEREACAKVCESLFDMDDDSCNEAELCAAAIRARGNQ